MILIPDLKPIYFHTSQDTWAARTPPDPGAAGAQPPTPTPDPAAQQELRNAGGNVTPPYVIYVK